MVNLWTDKKPSGCGKCIHGDVCKYRFCPYDAVRPLTPFMVGGQSKALDEMDAWIENNCQFFIEKES